MRLLFFVVGVGLLFNTSAQEAKVKSGLIHYISKNVNWPENRQTGDFIISVIGKSDVTSELNTLSQSKKIGSRDIIIEELSNAEEIRRSHIVFLPKGYPTQLFIAIFECEKINALLITEEPDFAQKGSPINFLMEGQRIAYEVNSEALSRANLQLSTKLINMSK